MGFKKMRERANLTQVEVAEKLGYKNHTTVGGWEKGKWIPQGKRLLAVAELYGCTVDELLKGD